MFAICIKTECTVLDYDLQNKTIGNTLEHFSKDALLSQQIKNFHHVWPSVHFPSAIPRRPGVWVSVPPLLVTDICYATKNRLTTTKATFCVAPSCNIRRREILQFACNIVLSNAFLVSVSIRRACFSRI